MAGKKGGAVKGEHPGAASALFESLKDRRQFQFQELCGRVNRLGAAARDRSAVLERLAPQLGLNLDELRRQQAADEHMLLEQVKELEEAAAELLKKQSLRQRQALRTITDHADRFEYKKGNPHTSICLWRAVAPPNIIFNPQTFSEGVTDFIAPAPAAATVRVGQNIFRVSAEVVGGLAHDFVWNSVAAVDLFTQHVFAAAVPHGGSLSVTATYVPNGFINLVAPGDFIFAGGAGAEVSLGLEVAIATAAGDRIELPLGETPTILDVDIQASWDGQSRVVPVSPVGGVAYELARNNLVNVQEGDTVTVTAEFDIYLTGWHRGRAVARFGGQPLGINVPMVLLRIDG
jgi:hypothetical protein